MIPSSLAKGELERYSRQILLPEIGVAGQERLKAAAVLVVGAGGLGSPACLYLAAAGVGRLGIVDYDRVDVGNLHRQVIHGEDRLGATKAESARRTLGNVNSACAVEAHNCLLSRSNALELIQQYDLVLDASDNAATRYLINDASVLLGRPIVSGAALRFDGQLTTYGFRGSACYRCVYPQPPHAELVVNCDAGGVAGPVTGVIGSLQALEALRILAMGQSDYAGKLLLFNGLGGAFRTLTLRARSPACAVCGDAPTITRDLPDYELFCGARADDKSPDLDLLGPADRITCRDFARCRSEVAILDVRPAGQLDICCFPGSINIPIGECPRRVAEIKSLAAGRDLVVVCRRGNDSQLAVRLLKEAGVERVRDLIGGFRGYATDVDPALPQY